jgi:peptidoglycan/xylan/chitin deacetylase (PgdA/CDA1 family)
MTLVSAKMGTSAKTALKDRLKAFLYHAGIATLWGRRASRDALTIVMFHRVLPQGDPRSQSADPDYTVDLAVFESFLTFLEKHFQPVSLAQVEAALAGVDALPPHALLVTFDDGWEDTARHAAPALARRGMPSLLFVTSGALECEHTLWRDTAAILARAGLLPSEGEPAAAGLEKLPATRRHEILAEALAHAGDTVRPLMMRPADVTAVLRQGMAIGAHGVSHTPLTASDDAGKELRQSKNELERRTGVPVLSFAYPHGRYDPAILQQTLASGYRLAFTSDSILNRLEQGKIASPVLGRVALSQKDIVDAHGRFSPVRALFHILSRRSTILDRRLGAFRGPDAPAPASSYG